MSKNEIVSHLYKTGELRKIILSFINNKGDYQFVDDLEQDVYLQLLTMDEDKLFSLTSKKTLNYYLVGLVNNQINSSTSPFHYKYRKPEQHEEICDISM